MKQSSYPISLKVAALFTTFIFCITNLTYAQGPLHVPLPSDQKMSIPLPEHLNIPEDIGSIQEEFQSDKKGPFVVFIQDAHVIVDAQSNIGNLIQHLQEKYGIRLVALEGGKGKMDPTLLRAFPDGNIKKHVMDGYLERGEVTGGELSAVMSEREAKFFGIEDWKLYEENYVAFLRAMQRKEMMVGELEERKLGLDEKRKTVYSEAHNEFHGHVQAFREEKEHLLSLLQYLKGVESAQSMAAEKKGGVAAAYPHLWVLYKTIEKDASIDRGSLSMEIKKLAGKIQKKYGKVMVKKELMEWNSKNQDFVTGRMDEGGYLKYVLKVAEGKNERVELTAGMRELLGHVDTMATIKGTKMFSELEEFIDDLEDGLMKSDEERRISEEYKRLLIMKDLAGLELSREKLERLQSDEKGYLGLLKRPGLADAALAFYRLAVERDNALRRNLLELMKREGEESAIVLAGGFHTEGFARGLKEEGCSYVLVTPRINSLKGHDLYEEVMKGKLSYKDMIKTTFYDAFMRHSSMKLVAELNERDFRKVVKEWRDGVIRRLAEEGRTAEAGEYTKYIDLLMKVYIEKYGVEGLTSKSKEEVLKDIEKALSDYEEKTLNGMWQRFEGTLKRFTDGAQGLIDRKEVTVEAVSNLLQESAVQTSKLQAVRGILGRDLSAEETARIINLAGEVAAETVTAGVPLENVGEQVVAESVARYFGQRAAKLPETVSETNITAAMPTVTAVVANTLAAVNQAAAQVPSDVAKVAEPSAQMTEALGAQVTQGLATVQTGLNPREQAVAVERAAGELANAASLGDKNAERAAKSMAQPDSYEADILNSIMATKKGEMLSKEEFEAFMKQNNMSDVATGTHTMNFEYFLYREGVMDTSQLHYLRGADPSVKKAEAEKILAFARYLTEIGIFYPNVQWGMYKTVAPDTGQEDYQVFAVMRYLSNLEANQDVESIAVNLMKKLEPALDDYMQRNEMIPETSMFMALNFAQLDHGHNLGVISVNGETRYYARDVAVLDFSLDGSRAVIDEWYKNKQSTASAASMGERMELTEFLSFMKGKQRASEPVTINYTDRFQNNLFVSGLVGFVGDEWEPMLQVDNEVFYPEQVRGVGDVLIQKGQRVNDQIKLQDGDSVVVELAGSGTVFGTIRESGEIGFKLDIERMSPGNAIPAENRKSATVDYDSLTRGAGTLVRVRPVTIATAEAASLGVDVQSFYPLIDSRQLAIFDQIQNIWPTTGIKADFTRIAGLVRRTLASQPGMAESDPAMEGRVRARFAEAAAAFLNAFVAQYPKWKSISNIDDSMIRLVANQVSRFSPEISRALSDDTRVKLYRALIKQAQNDSSGPALLRASNESAALQDMVKHFTNSGTLEGTTVEIPAAMAADDEIIQAAQLVSVNHPSYSLEVKQTDSSTVFTFHRRSDAGTDASESAVSGASLGTQALSVKAMKQPSFTQKYGELINNGLMVAMLGGLMFAAVGVGIAGVFNIAPGLAVAVTVPAGLSLAALAAVLAVKIGDFFRQRKIARKPKSSGIPAAVPNRLAPADAPGIGVAPLGINAAPAGINIAPQAVGLQLARPAPIVRAAARQQSFVQKYGELINGLILIGLLGGLMFAAVGLAIAGTLAVSPGVAVTVTVATGLSVSAGAAFLAMKVQDWVSRRNAEKRAAQRQQRISDSKANFYNSFLPAVARDAERINAIAADLARNPEKYGDVRSVLADQASIKPFRMISVDISKDLVQQYAFDDQVARELRSELLTPRGPEEKWTNLLPVIDAVINRYIEISGASLGKESVADVIGKKANGELKNFVSVQRWLQAVDGAIKRQPGELTLADRQTFSTAIGEILDGKPEWVKRRDLMGQMVDTASLVDNELSGKGTANIARDAVIRSVAAGVLINAGRNVEKSQDLQKKLKGWLGQQPDKNALKEAIKKANSATDLQALTAASLGAVSELKDYVYTNHIPRGGGGDRSRPDYRINTMASQLLATYLPAYKVETAPELAILFRDALDRVQTAIRTGNLYISPAHETKTLENMLDDLEYFEKVDDRVEVVKKLIEAMDGFIKTKGPVAASLGADNPFDSLVLQGKMVEMLMGLDLPQFRDQQPFVVSMWVGPMGLSWSLQEYINLYRSFTTLGYVGQEIETAFQERFRGEVETLLQTRGLDTVITPEDLNRILQNIMFENQDRDFEERNTEDEEIMRDYLTSTVFTNLNTIGDLRESLNGNGRVLYYTNLINSRNRGNTRLSGLEEIYELAGQPASNGWQAVETEVAALVDELGTLVFRTVRNPERARAAILEDLKKYFEITLQSNFYRFVLQAVAGENDDVREAVLELARAHLSLDVPASQKITEEDLQTAYHQRVTVLEKQGRKLSPDLNRELKVLQSILGERFMNGRQEQSTEAASVNASIHLFVSLLDSFSGLAGASSLGQSLGSETEVKPADQLLEGLDKAAAPGELSPLERVADALNAGNREQAVAIVQDHARQKFDAIKAQAAGERQNFMNWFGEFQAVEQLASLVYSADFGEQIKDVMSRTPGTYAMFGNGEGVLFTGLLDVLKTAVSGEATRRIDAAVEEEIGKMTDEERAALRDILNEARAALEGKYKGKQFVLGINYNDRQKEVVTKTLEKFAGFIDRYILLSEKGQQVKQGQFPRPVQVMVVSKNTVDRAVAQASRGALGRLLYLFTADLGLRNRIPNFAMRANIDEIGREEDQALAYETVLTALFSAGLVKSDKELETMSAEELEKLIGELPGSFQIGFERGKDGAFNVQVLALVASLIAMAKERAAVAKAA